MRTIRQTELPLNVYTVKAEGVVVRVVEARGFDEAEKKFLAWVAKDRPKLKTRAHTIAFISRAKDVIR